MHALRVLCSIVLAALAWQLPSRAGAAHAGNHGPGNGGRNPVAVVLQSPGNAEVVAAVSATLSAGSAGKTYTVKAVNATGLADGAAKGADVLVVPSVTSLSDGAMAAYEAFATAGGMLFVVGEMPPRARRGVDLGLYTLDIMSTYEPYLFNSDAGVVRLRSHAAQADKFELRAQEVGVPYFVGLSAVTFTSQSDAVFVPVVDALDQFNRTVGWAASVTTFSDGPFAGGRWLVSGITGPALLNKAFLAELVSNLDVNHAAEASGPQRFVGAARNHAVRESPRAAPAVLAHLDSSRALERAGASALDMLQLDNNRTHIVHSSAPMRRFFAVGMDYYRSATAEFSLEVIAGDIALAAAAGLNSMRMFGFANAIETNATFAADLARLANEYGIYMLFDLDCYKDPLQNTSSGIRERTAAQVAPLKDEPWVLGFDMCNEPNNDFGKIADVYVNETTKLIDMYPFKSHGLNNFTTLTNWLCGGWSSSYASCQQSVLSSGGPLTADLVPPALQPVFADVSNILETWTNWKIDAARNVAGDKTHLLTVGNNGIFGMFSANAPLDFVAHHTYPRNDKTNVTCMDDLPTNVSNVPSVLDRLKTMWGPRSNSPHGPRPIMMGEFGIRTDGGLWQMEGSEHCHVQSFASAAAWDAMMWYRALSLNTDGAIRWELTEQPYVLLAQHMLYIGNDSDPTTHVSYTGGNRFGAFWYDGTGSATLRPKPVAYVSKAIGAYIARGTWQRQAEGGAYTFVENVAVGCSMPVAWTFSGKDVLALGGGCGSRQASGVSASPRLGGTTTTVFHAHWGSKAIHLVVASDTNVSVEPAHFVSGIQAEDAALVGQVFQLTRNTTHLSFTQLAGTWVCVAAISSDCAE